MPANKPHQDRGEKRAELLSAARRLFIEDGYEATSMAALAKSVGVAGNTIYWYFTDKDDVLLTVLNAVLSDVMADYQKIATAPLEDQLVWVVRQLRQVNRLVNTVHSRVAQAPAIDAWHNNFHEVTEGMLRSALEQAGVDRTAIDAEVKIGVFTVEGLLTHGLDDAQQEGICRRLAREWTDPLGQPSAREGSRAAPPLAR